MPSRSRSTQRSPQRALERANLEAARLADAEVTSEHVLLALASQWENACFATGWLARCGITAQAVRQRAVDATEGAALPKPPMLLGPPPTDHPGLAAELDLAPNPLGHDPRRRGPWTSMAFDVPEDRPPQVGMLARQYFLDRDRYPVLTTDGRPVHIVVDEHGLPVLDEQGHEMLGPVEVPQGSTVILGTNHPDRLVIAIARRSLAPSLVQHADRHGSGA